MNLQFQHEVVTPFVRFKERAAENICVQDRVNDVIVLAQEAATAAYHFPEVIRGAGPMVDPEGELLRQMLGDVVDSRKHGTLRDPRRQVIIYAALAFEFNDAEEFKYLGTQILAENDRFGEFEIAETLEKFIGYLCSEFSINVRVKIEVPINEFSKKLVTYFTDKAVFAQNLRLLTFKRMPNGDLVRSDPNSVHLEVYDLSKGQPGN